MSYRKSFEVVGYAYDADLHCLDCTEKRFGVEGEESFGVYGEETKDSEGNSIHPIFLDSLQGGEVCGDCLEPIE